VILLRDLSQPIVAGFSLTAPQVDLTPDPITGQVISNAQLSNTIEFSPVQITGIDAEITASIAGGLMRVSPDGQTYGAYSAVNQPVNNDYWVQVRAVSSDQHSTPITATLSAGGLSTSFVVTTIQRGVQTALRFSPALLTTHADQITVFRGRENLIDVLVKHDSIPIDLTVFDSFELYGLTDSAITTDSNPQAIVGDANGLVQLNLGLLVTRSGLRETTLIGYAPDVDSGIVLWDDSLPRSSITAKIVDTFTAEQAPEVSLTNGLRLQLQSRTNNALLADGVGFTIHIIEKGVSIEGLATDSDGYLIIQDVSLDTLGEPLTIAIVTSDEALTGLTKATVEDLTTYLI